MLKLTIIGAMGKTTSRKDFRLRQTAGVHILKILGIRVLV